MKKKNSKLSGFYLGLIFVLMYLPIAVVIEFHHILIHSRIQMESKRSFLWYFLLGLSPIYLLSKTNINWFEYLNLSCVTE